MITRQITKWVEEKQEEVINNNDENIVVGCLKSFGLGFIDGIVDYCTILGAIVLTAGIAVSVSKKK